jgi:predicted  nucleic acid-binding Zn-ribbon protein
MNIAINDINGNQLYYTCVTDPRLSKKELDENPNIYTAGSLYNSDFENVKNNTILTGNWETLAKKNCGAVYKFVNNWRTENCPKLNAQTYWNYNNQCSTYLRSQQMEKDQAAAAEADAKKAAADATQKAATDAEIQKRAAMSSEDAAMSRNFSTTMADYRTKLDKFESMTQEELETLINEINAYWKKSLINRSSEDEKRYRSVFPKFNAEFKTKFPALTVLLNTK